MSTRRSSFIRGGKDEIPSFLPGRDRHHPPRSADIDHRGYKHAQRILRDIYAKAMAGDMQSIKEYLYIVLGEAEVIDDDVQP